VTPPAATPGPWWDDRRFHLLIVVLTTAPLWWPVFPPLTDLPGHMGRYRVMLDHAHVASLGQGYGYEWRLIGNLGVDLLIVPVAAIFGLELATKLIVISIVAASAAGIVWLSREVHGRVSPTAYAALPFVLGYPFTFGFVNYMLSMALALTGCALWLHLGRAGRYRLRGLVFVPAAFAVWIAHSFGWGVLCALCFTGEAVREADGGRSSLAAGLRSARRCLVLAPPAILMILWRSADATGATRGWFQWEQKLAALLMSLNDRWLWFDVGTLFAIAALLYVLLRGARFQMSRILGAAALMLGLLFCLLPDRIFGSAFADMRLIPYVLLLAVLAIRPRPDTPRRVAGLAAIACLSILTARLTGHIVSFAIADQHNRRALAALDHVPEGARIAAFVQRQPGRPWFTGRKEHLASMAIVRRAAYTNDQWAVAGAQLLTIRKADAPGFSTDPSQMTTVVQEPNGAWRSTANALRDVPRDAFDFIWLIDVRTLDRREVPGTTRVWRDGFDSLHRIDR
jgi:hypothetical protein